MKNRWAVDQGHVPSSPAASLTRLKVEGERPAYRTLTEVKTIIERGGLSAQEELDLWECIFRFSAILGDIRMSRGRYSMVCQFGGEPLPPSLTLGLAFAGASGLY